MRASNRCDRRKLGPCIYLERKSWTEVAGAQKLPISHNLSLEQWATLLVSASLAVGRGSFDGTALKLLPCLNVTYDNC